MTIKDMKKELLKLEAKIRRGDPNEKGYAEKLVELKCMKIALNC